MVVPTVFMTQESLHGSGIVAGFQQMGRERLQDGMAGTALSQLVPASALYPDRS
jgi:hypothetical protein